MEVRTFTRLAFLFFSLTVSYSLLAQSSGKAKVQIKKNENGATEEYTQEFELEDGQDIQDILRELDLLDEFGQLKDGEAFEINIRKLDGEDELKNYDISFFPEEAGQPFLGVRLKEVHQEMDFEGSSESIQPGAYVTEIIDGTGAEVAGLQAGDIIYEIDDEPVDDVQELVETILSKDVGDEIKVEYLRDGKKKKVQARLGDREPEEYSYFYFDEEDFEMPEFEDFDVILAPYMEELENTWSENMAGMEESSFLGVTPGCESMEGEGVEIGCIVEGSSAEDMGILKNDRITSFNGKAVSNFDELADQIQATEPGEEVKIELLRNGKKKTIKGEIGVREYSVCDEMMVFPRFEGMDENGDFHYNYQFNMDDESMIEWQEQLQEMLEENQVLMEERK